MNGFLYTLTLEEPVLANSLGGEPNSANSLYYIPGGLLRGAAIAAYTGKKDAEDEAFRRLFLDGQTRYLNAYPLSADGHRSLPTPLQFKKPKYFEASDFSNIIGQKINALNEELQINVHTQRDAELGHATTDAGAVYRYVALPAGLQLRGAVLTVKQSDADEIEKLLKGKSILLGKARTAGYGHASIQTEPLGDWSEGGGHVTSSEFTLTLLSPVLVRDENGQFSLDIQTALAARLGASAVIEEGYCRSEIVGGFNRIWGLPLPQVTAIAAGSHFKITASVDAKILQDLQETGIGERRAEGFGRLAFNLVLPDKVEDEDWCHVDPKIDKSNTAQPVLAQNETANLMLKRLARRELDEKVIHAAREATREYLSKENKIVVPNSQLSRWRVLVRNILENPDLPRLLKFCADSKGKPGWKKMEKARVYFNGQRQRLTEWIESLLNEPTALYLSTEIPADYQRSLGLNSFKMTDTLNIEYRLRLLDAVLAILSKKNGGSHD